jgi:NitT/TauT family transport system substrate-binding protein
LKKKILWLIGCLLLIGLLTYLIVKPNKKDNDLTPITLAEVTHSVFYTPMYVAIENGYFKDEGIDINLLLTPGADKVSAAVISGDADIGFAGAESAIYVYNGGEQDYLKIFSGLTKRDGQFIVSRDKKDNFEWKDLEGQEVLVGRATGMPALNFMRALKNAGVDTSKIKINSSVDFASLSGAFIGGTGSYVNLFEPNATLLEKQNYGYVVASIGELSGEVPYTVFYSKKSYLDNNKELLTKFTNAINKGLIYTQENDSQTIAEAIIKQFPDTKINDLKVMIERYKDNDCWLESPFINEKIYNNLKDFLKENNLITKDITYSDIVNNLYKK